MVSFGLTDTKLTQTERTTMADKPEEQRDLSGDQEIMMLKFDPHNPLVPGSSPGGPTFPCYPNSLFNTRTTPRTIGFVGDYIISALK